MARGRLAGSGGFGPTSPAASSQARRSLARLHAGSDMADAAFTVDGKGRLTVRTSGDSPLRVGRDGLQLATDGTLQVVNGQLCAVIPVAQAPRPPQDETGGTAGVSLKTTGAATTDDNFATLAAHLKEIMGAMAAAGLMTKLPQRVPR